MGRVNEVVLDYAKETDSVSGDQRNPPLRDAILTFLPLRCDGAGLSLFMNEILNFDL